MQPDTAQPIFLLSEHHRADVNARRAPLARGELIGGALLALAFGAFLLVACYFILRQTAIWWQLRQSGVETMAHVINTEYHSDADSDWYVVTFSYVAAGQKRETTASYGDDPGFSTLQVRYLPDDPTTAWPVEDLAIWYGIGGLFGALLMVPLTGAYVIWMLPEIFRDSARKWHGVLLAGRAVRHIEELDCEGDTLLRVFYEFTAPDGRVLRGESSAYGRPAPPAGAAVAVLYHDKDCHRLL